MKKVLAIALAVFFICSIGHAAQTGRCLWHSHSYTDNDTCDYQDRYNEFEYKKGNPLGIGLDVTVYEFSGELNNWGADSIEVLTLLKCNRNGILTTTYMKAI